MTWALVYLHGVGQAVHTDEWYTALNTSLASYGVELPALDSPRIIRPTYVDLLKCPPTVHVDEPSRTAKPLDDSASATLERRAEYSRAQARSTSDLPGLSARAGFNGFGSDLNPMTNPLLARRADFDDARNYLSNEPLRYGILHRIIHDIGTQRDLVVVGHSLGSLVAIDLLGHLPPGVHIRRLVTLGSPAASDALHRINPERKLRAKRFPYHQVDGWVNLVSPQDVVTFGRGITDSFPAAVDVAIALPWLEHDAAAYLRHPATAKVIADAVAPVVARSTESTALDIPLTDAEQVALDNLVYARFVRDRIDESERHDKRRRFDLALRQVSMQCSRQLIDQRNSASQPIPEALRLASEGQVDDLRLGTEGINQQLYTAVLAATDNPLRPFEIQATEEQLSAVEDLWCGYGHSASDAVKVAAAIREARRAFGNGDNWKWIALGAAGLALVALSPVGLAIGGAELASGTAASAGLATLGPGGIVGGMALAGGLIGFGSSAFAANFTLPSAMTPDMLQTQCVRFMAFSKASADLALTTDPWIGWLSLSDYYSELAGTAEQLRIYSDAHAPALKAVSKKLDIVKAALAWMVDHELRPVIEAQAHA